MHMKELPMFTYNLWIDCLHQDKSCQLFCPVINIAMSNNFKHSHLHFSQLFYSNKARFIHTSTVKKITFLPWKKYAYALRASCFYIETNIFEIF